MALGKVERGGYDAVVLLLGVNKLPDELLKAKVSANPEERLRRKLKAEEIDLPSRWAEEAFRHK